MPLKTYRPQQQHAGTFLAGFPWTYYFTGTFYRLPKDDSDAARRLDRFLTRVREAVGCPKEALSCYAVLEDRYPGLGGRPVRKHWHGLLACPEYPRFHQTAKQLWEAQNGWFKIGPYDPADDGPFYVSKLVADGAYIHDINLNRLKYGGPTDLLEAAAPNPYVADGLKDKLYGEYLVVSSHPAAG